MSKLNFPGDVGDKQRLGWAGPSKEAFFYKMMSLIFHFVLPLALEELSGLGSNLCWVRRHHERRTNLR